MPKPLPLGATATTAASGGNREELLGPRPAGCERQRSRRWEPQPGQFHRRWRRGQARLSRVIYTAMGIGFCQSDAIAVFLFLCGILALSGASRQLPQRGSLSALQKAGAPSIRMELLLFLLLTAYPSQRWGYPAHRRGRPPSRAVCPSSPCGAFRPWDRAST